MHWAAYSLITRDSNRNQMGACAIDPKVWLWRQMHVRCYKKRIHIRLGKKFIQKGFLEKGTLLLDCWLECKLMQSLWRTVWTFLKSLKTELPYDPAIPLWFTYPEKSIIQKDTGTPMFTVAPFKMSKTQKQSKCPSTDGGIKMWYIYTVEHYSAIRMNEIMPFAAKRMYLEIIIPSEVSKRKTNITWYHLYVESKIWYK